MNRQQAEMNRQQAEIDWDNAPEGATHRFKTGGFYKIANAVTYYFDSYRNWIPSDNNQEWLNKNLIPRPTEQPYMPQVGEVCEYDSKGSAKIEISDFDFGEHCIVDLWDDGDRIEVLAHSEHRDNFVLVVKNKTAKVNIFSAILPEYVRPLKTERGELIEIIDSCNMSSGVLADVILKAGYRKND